MADLYTPTATEAYGGAWAPLRAYFVDLFLIGIVWTACAIPGGVLHHRHAPVASALYHIFVMAPLNFGGLYAYLRAARGERPELSDLFEAFRSAYGRTILAHILFVVCVGMGLMLLVVPGIFIAVRLAFVPFLVVDERMDAVGAIAESWRRTKGHGGTIFVLWLLAIPISIGGLMLLGVGIIPALIWIHLAFATLFAAVTASEEEAQTVLAGSPVSG